MPLTLAQAKALTHQAILHHVSLKNTDGTPLRARVNGVPKVWKRDSARVQVPMKYGLKECFYITQDNLGEWELSDSARAAMNNRNAKVVGDRIHALLGF